MRMVFSCQCASAASSPRFATTGLPRRGIACVRGLARISAGAWKLSTAPRLRSLTLRNSSGLYGAIGRACGNLSRGSGNAAARNGAAAYNSWKGRHRVPEPCKISKYFRRPKRCTKRAGGTCDPDGRAHCYLCPRHCHIGDGQAGFCFIRVNQGGKLYSLGYASPAALQIDPIEKKPLNHFLPGTRVFSLGTAGCNMGCFFCQNWDISKSKADQVNSTHISPEEVVLLAIRYGCPSIAFTYNEPTIWGEYVIDICAAAEETG